MAAKQTVLARIQDCIQNRLDHRTVGNRRIVGIIGDAPSQYAKSPTIWNPTFRRLEMEAIYLPFDVEEHKLPDLVQALKSSPQVLGANVTVPYKIQIMNYLDGLDDKASQIKAVNTLVRTQEGQLWGYNTDGSGFLESILTTQPGQKEPFLSSVEGLDTLMLGAGGAARAVAFYLAESLGNGRLFISNRTRSSAVSLAREVSQAYGNAGAIDDSKVPEYAPKVGLIVNCSTKGQSGIRKLPDGQVTLLEAYSALAPTKPATLAGTGGNLAVFYQNWLRASLLDIEANHKASLSLALSIPPQVPFCDLIYSPLETVFLWHGRLSGHRTLNGKGMNVAQAVSGFVDRICNRYLKEQGKDNAETRKLVQQTMYEAW